MDSTTKNDDLENQLFPSPSNEVLKRFETDETGKLYSKENNQTIKRCWTCM